MQVLALLFGLAAIATFVRMVTMTARSLGDDWYEVRSIFGVIGRFKRVPPAGAESERCISEDGEVYLLSPTQKDLVAASVRDAAKRERLKQEIGSPPDRLDPHPKLNP